MSVPAVSEESAPALARNQDLLLALWRNLVLPVLSILAALAVGALVLVLAGYDAGKAYGALWNGVFGNTRNMGEAFLRATPLVLVGAGIAVAFRCGIWNLGAEGQFYMGAIAGTYVGLQAGGLSPFIAIPLGLLAGFLLGGAWASIGGWMKVRLGLNEVVTTIMLNYIALGIVSFMVNGPLQEKAHANPQTDQIAKSMFLPLIWPPTRVHLGFIFAVVVAAVLAFILFRTRWGYAIRAVGFNQEAARHAGINVSRQFLLAMVLSGGAAGIAGAVQIMGVTQSALSRSFSRLRVYGHRRVAASQQPSAGHNPLRLAVRRARFGLANDAAHRPHP